MRTTVVYKKIHSCEIKADFHPSPYSNGQLVIYIHGGGFIWGSRNDLSREQIELYHQAKFHVFSIDYRLAPETKLPEIINDIKDAIKWLKKEGPKQFNIDPTKIAVVGCSAGGYLALMTGTFKTKPKAIVSFYGYGNIGGKWATAPSRFHQTLPKVPQNLAKLVISRDIISESTIEKRYSFYLYGRQQGVWIRDVSGTDKLTKLKQYCPMHLINDSFPPSLLLHGIKDTDVPYRQSEELASILEKADIPHTLIPLPEADHMFDRNLDAPSVQDAFRQVIEFLTFWINR